MRTLYLDCFSGISGDMTVGALCDLGVSPSTFEWELAKLDLEPFHTHFEKTSRNGISAVKFSVHEGETHTPDQDEPCSHEHLHSHSHSHEHTHSHSHEHGHSHSHEHEHGHMHEHDPAHAHEHTHEHDPHCAGHEHDHSHSHADDHVHGRRHDEIRALIQNSDLSEFVKKHALSIFQRIAVAEGRIHNVPPEKVAFHEVGALDSIADILCVCAGIEQLAVDRIVISPLVEGRGWVNCAHGRFPVPAPAVLEILKGLPLGSVDFPYETITPTGAAIAAEFAESFAAMPAMRILKTGYGAGSRQTQHQPNVLRAILGESMNAPAAYEMDTVLRLETNLDDVSPEISGNLLDRLLTAGALDAFFTPVQMKKNRPAVQITVLCEPAQVGTFTDLLFSETTSFGVRMDEVRRLKLDRRMETVTTPYGEVTVKLGLRLGVVSVVSPEFESVRSVSESSGQPLRVVFDAAKAAATEKWKC